MEQTGNANGRIQNESPKTNGHSESEEVIFNPTVKPDVREFTKFRNNDETLQLLNYVENWVLKHLDERETKHPKAKYFRELANKYLAKAQNFYKNDPLGYSKMVLTMLKIIQVRSFRNRKYRISLFSFLVRFPLLGIRRKSGQKI